MHNYRGLLLLILGFVAFEAACDKNSAPTVTAVPAAEAATPASTQPANSSEGPLIVSGPLIVEHQVEVAAQRDGILTKIEAEPGARVKTGDVLALLDDRQLSADLEAARAKTRSIAADLKNWEAESKVMDTDYERAQKLWDAHVIPQEELQHAQYKAESEKWDILRVKELLTNAQDNERSLELELEKTRIRAPFDGLVARRYVREGQQVGKGDHLFWVTAEAPLRMRFTLPERFYGQLTKGEPLPLSSPDVPEESHVAKVIEISPVVDPSSGTIDVLLELTGQTGHLRPGMTARVTVENPR
jgi:membrane fusion protein, multidrug efflux system